MKKIILTLFLLFLTNPVFAYEPTSTHAALTENMVDFFNLFAPENQKLSGEDKEAIVRGSIEEDNDARYFNHFYDPVYNRGWTGYPTSKVWAQAPGKRVLTLGNDVLAIEMSNVFSWQNGIQHFAAGRRTESLVALGHVLHLLEDASVPEHTRNDTHISEKDSYGILKHSGSPFESWTPRFNRDTLHVAEEYKNHGLQMLNLYNLNAYFDDIAKYSNGYFFSEDTINSLEYTNPNIQENQRILYGGANLNFGMGKDMDGILFPMTRILDDEIIWRNGVTKQTYTVNNDLVLENYWSRLSKAAILNGAGVIKLYFAEIEKAKQDTLLRSSSAEATADKPWWASVWDTFKSAIGWDAFTAPQQSASMVDIFKEQIAAPRPEAVEARNDTTTTPSPSGSVLGVSVSPRPFVSAFVIPMETGIQDPGSRIESGMTHETSPSPAPSPAPTFLGGGGTGIQSASPTPHSSPETTENTASPTPSPTPTPSPEPDSTSSPQATPIPDTTAPNFTFAVLARSVTTSTIQLVWNSEDIDLASWELEVYSCGFGSGCSPSTGLGTDHQLLSATTTSYVFIAPSDDTTYYFRLRARDKTGNVSAWQEHNTQYSRKPIVINEVAWMGTKASAFDEWIELANKTREPISVTGWKIRVQTIIIGRNFHDIPLAGTIPPDGQYLAERTDDTTVSDIPADRIFTGSLNNEYTQLFLLDTQEQEIDATPFYYQWAAGDNQTKRTMERVRSELPGDDLYNWFTNDGAVTHGLDATSSPIFGTPKKQNSAYRMYTSVGAQQFLHADTTWTHEQSPYYIPRSLYVMQNATLNIEKGVVVKFGPNVFVDTEGVIHANGTAAEPVVFTAFTDDEYPGDTNRDATATVPVSPYWQRITLHSTSRGSEFHHTLFRYGGTRAAATFDYSSAFVSVEETDAVFDHATFDHGYKNGLRLIHSNSRISDSIFSGFTVETVSVPCEMFGGQALLVSSGSPIIERTVIDGAIRGLRFCNATPIVRDNIFRRTQTPVQLNSSLGEFRGNHIEDSQEYGISLNGVINGSGTLTKDVHPYILDNITLFSPYSLTIEPGTILKMRPSNNANLTVYGGSINALGTAENPITITALADDSVGGDTNGDATSTLPWPGAWYTLSLAASSTGIFSYTNIRYGGGARNGLPLTWTMVESDSPTLLTFDHAEISDSLTHGVTLTHLASGTVAFTRTAFTRNSALQKSALYLNMAVPTVTDSYFGGNYIGILAADAISRPLLQNTIFENNVFAIVPPDLLP